MTEHPSQHTQRDTSFNKLLLVCVFPLLCRYMAFYGASLSGFFFDQGSNVCEDVPYYDSLVQYVKTTWLPATVTVLNWGTGASKNNVTHQAAHCMGHGSHVGV